MCFIDDNIFVMKFSDMFKTNIYSFIGCQNNIKFSWLEISNIYNYKYLDRISSLSSFTAINFNTRQQGIHFLNSLIQFPKVDLGATIMNGPLTFLNSFRKATKAIVYIVFPKPISSANIPFIPSS